MAMSRHPTLLRALVCALALLPAAAAAQSLYDEGSFRSLTADARAHAPGDTLTVQVVESSSATSTANTSANKQAGLGVTVGSTSRTEKGTLDLNESFAGKGSIQRSGRLLAQLSVTVQDVAPNGDLLIAGRQLIEINGEKQHIDIEGRVRPTDIDETNTVLSSRIADAKITYVGDGILGEKQHEGLVGRILSWLGIL